MEQECTGPRWGVTAIPFSHFILNELINKGVSQNVIPSGYNTGGAEMFAFTEQGVAMLATILKSPNAVDVSITILRAFVAMRHFLLTNAQIFLRLERVESKQHETDAKIEQVFAKLEEKTLKPQQGLFFDGLVFDAYEFVCNLIKRASSRIILIDNYVDESVLTMLDKRKQCPIRSGMTVELVGHDVGVREASRAGRARAQTESRPS